MTGYWQTIHGQPPSKSNTYRVVTVGGHGSLAKTPGLKEYERSFYMQSGAYRGAGITGYFTLEVRVYFRTMSHDLDNSLKVILDCLQACGAIANDNKCVRIVADKFLDKADPRIEFRINPVEL